MDLTNRKFGRLLVIERASPIGVKHIDWLVICECGVSKVVNGDGLKKGSIKSCGCLRRDMGTWNIGKIGPESHTFQGCGEVPKSYFSELKSKAGTRGIVFDIPIEYLSELYESQRRRCALSGIEIYMPRRHFIVNNCASLDRIDSRKGYQYENVQWVDRRINFMKQAMNDEDFIFMCKLVAQQN